MTKFGTILFIIIFLALGIVLGVYANQFYYDEKCLDMGGGKNPGNYKICVLEKVIEKEKIIYRMDKEDYLCDKNGNKFISEKEAKKYGLNNLEFGEDYCLR